MRYLPGRVCLSVLLLTSFASAQEIVHALSGTLIRVDPAQHRIVIKTNDGSDGTFAFPSGHAQEVSFSNDVKGRTTAVAQYKGTAGDNVVLYFYGGDPMRTAVAIQDLGAGPLDDVEGTVSRWDHHKQILTIKNSTGQEQSFKMSPKAMADSPTGAVAADHLDPSKGDNVRVIATKGSSPETAVFVRD